MTTVPTSQPRSGQSMREFTGPVAIVTGCTSGIEAIIAVEPVAEWLV